MQADPNPNNGDLALVYASTQSNFTENTQTQYITFPETVTLPSAVTDYIEIGLQPVDTSIMMDCYGELDEESFSLTVYGEGFMPRINYTSSDGIHYTRTGFVDADTGNPLENPVDFRTIMKFGNSWGELQWNDAIGYFMIVGSTNYDGLFNYVSANNQYEYVLTQLNAISEDVYDKSFYNGTGKFDGTLQNIANLSIDEVKRRINLYNDLSYLELNSNVTNLYKLFEDHYNLTSVPNFNTSNVTSMDGMFENCTNLTSVPNFNTSNVTSMTHMFATCTNLVDIPELNTIKVTNMFCMFDSCTNLVDIPELNTSNVTSMRSTFSKCNNLSNASIQNIINMCLNSNITNSSYMNLRTSAGYGPLYSTKFDNSYYQNRWSELTSAGWTY